MLMSEVFGEENFIGVIVRATGQTTGQDSAGSGSSFDYVVAYARSQSHEVQGIPLSDQDEARFSHQRQRGEYAYWQMRKTGSADRRADRPNMFYPVVAPDGSDITNWSRRI